MISLTGLNDPQREAASTIDGPVLILAGAGSGKTRTITYRIAHMVDNLNMDPKSILGVSFTNKASKEMKERVITLLGKRKARGITLATFHSLGVKILKEEIHLLGYHKNFSIYDTSDQTSIVREALKSIKTEKTFDRKQIMSKIGFLKNKGIMSDEFISSVYFDEDDPYDLMVEYVYRYYQDKLKFYNAIDFDDILNLVVRLFREHPDVTTKYSKKFQYVMVDEYQDTNPLQFELIMGLTKTHNNLCVVGDDDQAIYAFRGADVTNILEFEKKFSGAKVVKLEENYRSTMPILDLANKVIKENKNRREKSLWSKMQSDQNPLLWLTADTDHEAQVVVDEIVQHQGSGGHLGDMAILYRSNTQAQPIEDQLRLSQVPYTILGGQKFYEKKEVKDLIGYLSVILNPKDQIALRRILNIPHRGIGNITLEKYLSLADEKELTLFQALEHEPGLDPRRSDQIVHFTKLIRKFQESFENNPLPEAISSMVDDIGYLKFVEKSYDSVKQVDQRKNDVHMFVESAVRFLKYNQGQGSLKMFVERLLLQDNQDERDEDDDDDVRKNEVTMMTLHSSKGLEFDTVFLIGMEEETLPHKRVLQLGEDIGEERRLAYVGITRAQQKLVMTYCKERKLYGRKSVRHKSRFLNDLGQNYTEQDRTTFGHLTEDEATEYKSSFFNNLIDGLDD